MPETNINFGGWTGRTVAWVALICMLIGAGLGIWGYHTATHSAWLGRMHGLEKDLVAAKNKPAQVVQAAGRVETRTEIAYVPKETIRYMDPKTGREISAKELESLEITARPTDFYFKINGNAAKFTKEDSERWVFDKNKGFLEQKTAAFVEIRVPVRDDTRRTALIPSVLWDGKEAAAGGQVVRQIGSGRIGGALSVGVYSGGRYTAGLGVSF